MAAKITSDGLYRVTYGELPGLTNEELRQRQPEKFRTMLPGHPGPEEYKIVNFSPYRIHQRVAPSMRVGRFCLAADAAHREFLLPYSHRCAPNDLSMQSFRWHGLDERYRRRGRPFRLSLRYSRRRRR